MGEEASEPFRCRRGAGLDARPPIHTGQRPPEFKPRRAGKKDIVQTMSLLGSAFNGGPPFPPPALPGGTTSPSAIPVGPASFSRALPVSIPAGLIETDSLIRFHQPRPSSKPRVDSCIRLFEACSAFHSPYGLPSCLVAFSDLLHHRLQQSRCLHRWADAVFSI